MIHLLVFLVVYLNFNNNERLVACYNSEMQAINILIPPENCQEVLSDRVAIYFGDLSKDSIGEYSKGIGIL